MRNHFGATVKSANALRQSRRFGLAINL